MIFDEMLKTQPFSGYSEYMDYLFICVNTCIDEYLKKMKEIFASQQGGYKNVLYPDLELVHDMCKEHMNNFEQIINDKDGIKESDSFDSEDSFSEEMDEELLELLDCFSSDSSDASDEIDSNNTGSNDMLHKSALLTAEEMLEYINSRADLSIDNKVSIPFYEICKKLEFDNFTCFCFACGILASTQTDYASIFQVINENGNMTMPTIESAAKLYFGSRFTISSAYGSMSVCLEQLGSILDLNIHGNMPFATLISPDKRVIDYLFGKNPNKIDEKYVRFFNMLTDDKPLDPIMANAHLLEAMEISYKEGVRILSFYGDEGSGRKFFVRNFCRNNGIQAISVNCKKLFAYDFQFVEKAIWAVTRECILTNSCCCLEQLQYREEEKEKFQGYMDLAFAKLNHKDILVFALSKDLIDLREITRLEFTQIELTTPTMTERDECWKYFAKDYALDDDVDLSEMAAKFLFTPGKVKGALHQARSLATMNKDILIKREFLFKGCNMQMSSELNQKATRVDAKFGFDDIVMNADQRETVMHAIEQMKFKKQVYENWNYMKKYPYGRGLTVLLFGAPGTGKSMMAQVLAHELNLELYRVDISKVVDKYVGETEKSLSMIFREAKKCNVVLFFDECDTIFAKRSDDGGSNQASANNKTALLLQEMEAYDGVCVLATNYKHNIDPAFFRRMKYIVEFQFPDPDTREMLWRTTIPKDTPLAEDVDIRFLAERFEFAGGNIKNCILNAAFLAAADGDGKEVHMKHYLLAIKYEFVKTGKVFTRADFEPYASQIGLV
ncbi:MAG: ATP-binding protein [Lachnospiraceae bacterium]|nr:ATP-binding protein [Lachnospiraceae bacterium]